MVITSFNIAVRHLFSGGVENVSTHSPFRGIKTERALEQAFKRLF